jgi:hypothetical protein
LLPLARLIGASLSYHEISAIEGELELFFAG